MKKGLLNTVKKTVIQAHSHLHSLHSLMSWNLYITRVAQQSLLIWLYHFSPFIPVTKVCKTETKVIYILLDIL